MDGKVPVLVIKRVALDLGSGLLKYSISYCRSDLYVLCEVAPRAWKRTVAAAMPDTQLATAFPSSTASASDQPDASPASTPASMAVAAPMVSTTVAGNAGTTPEGAR